jgi:nickel transport protein
MTTHPLRVMPALAVLLALLAPAVGHGHGAGYQVVTDGTAVSLVFHYAGGQPMAYAAVRVFGPGDAEVEFQNGRTDRQGGFSFRPDRAGDWRIEVQDGRGHAVQATVPAAAPDPTGSALVPPPREPRNWQNATLGLSLIGNVFLALWVGRLVSRRNPVGNERKNKERKK